MAFVNSVAKPPRDVRRRQEKFGIKNDSTSMSAAASTTTKWVNAALVTLHIFTMKKACFSISVQYFKGPLKIHMYQTWW